jgi:cystathionine beta-lyase/cystathionine gamma-synthase
MKFESKTVHSGDRQKTGANWVPSTTPICTSSTFIYESTEQLDRVFGLEETGPSYARFDNPTRSALEALVTDLEGGAGAVACSSGMAALHTALLATLLDRPKRVLAADALYGTTTFMLMNIFGPMGVEPSFVNVFDPEAFEAAVIKTKPGAVIVETISNPLLRVAPLDQLARITRKHNVPLLVDSTFATPLLVRPLELGADIVIHSATKYLAGHGDVLGGVIVADETSYQALRPVARTLGPVLGPFDCYLTMRGIKTLALRMERQCANACRVGQWLAGHPAIERVYFPGDAAHPDAATVARLFPKGLAGGLVSFELNGADRAATMKFMDRLRMIVCGTSLGDVHTLIAHPVTASHRDVSPKQREKMGIRDSLLRLSVGIEAVDDIIADLEQALAL